MFLDYARMYNLESINGIKDILVAKKETLAVAESVTSGHLQAAISLASMATMFFQGGITTYNIHQKTRILKIDASHALSCNCVSERVAREMALNAAKLFQSDWSISITGYAAPIPELGVDDLFAYRAISYRGEVLNVDLLKSEKTDPLKVQIFYTNEVYKSFHQILKGIKQ
jgi:nicotinamide-nucleotide amidase